MDEAEKMSVVVIGGGGGGGGGVVSSTYMGLGKRKDRPLYFVLNVGSVKTLSEEERGL